MAKISVRHSVAAAYGLLFGRPLTVIGLTWLPAVFYAYVATYLIRHMNAVMALSAPGAAGRLGEFAYLPNFVALVVATALFGALISVSLSRHAFGMREEPAAAHLVFGMREFRLFLALLRYYALVVGSIVVFALVAGIAISQLTRNLSLPTVAITSQAAPLETWLTFLGCGRRVDLPALIYAVQAMDSFLPAIATVEDGARMERARSGAGNFLDDRGHHADRGRGPQGFYWSRRKNTRRARHCGRLRQRIAVCSDTDGGTDRPLCAFRRCLGEGLIQDGRSPCAGCGPVPPEVQAGRCAARSEAQAENWAVAREIFLPPEPSRMDVATPEADGASDAAKVFNWMVPPPDSHFGSDPDDAQHAHTEQISRHRSGSGPRRAIRRRAGRHVPCGAFGK